MFIKEKWNFCWYITMLTENSYTLLISTKVLLDIPKNYHLRLANISSSINIIIIGEEIDRI